MSLASEFLTTMAQALATMNLYSDGHPQRERAIDVCYGKLSDLQDEELHASFTLLRGEIIHNRRPIRELRHWDWGVRLSEARIQRLEFIGRVSREDLDAFLEEVFIRVSGAEVSSAEVRQGRPSNIRYGEAGIVGAGGSGTGADEVTTAGLGYSLEEEIQGVEWLHSELMEDRELHLVEAEGIVRSLSVAMHADQAFLLPLVRLKEYDQYTVTHTLNVSVLTMALAESLGLSPNEIRMFGIAGLLHDLGKVKVPHDILVKPGKLTESERNLIRTHPVEGARIILETEEHLDLAAVVAYEHHICIDGGGYPSPTFKRECHQASNLVHVCDVFDALRTDRPYREAYSFDRALKIIEDGAGTELDGEIARAFLSMMRRWQGQVAEVDMDRPEVLAPGEEDVVVDSPDDDGVWDLDDDDGDEVFDLD